MAVHPPHQQDLDKLGRHSASFTSLTLNLLWHEMSVEALSAIAGHLHGGVWCVLPTLNARACFLNTLRGHRPFISHLGILSGKMTNRGRFAH